MVVGIVIAIVFTSLPASVHAHRLQPAVATVSFSQGGEVLIDIRANFEVLLAGISQRHADTDTSPRKQQYDALRKLTSEALGARIQTFASDYLKGIALDFDTGPLSTEVDSVVVADVPDVRKARLSTLRLRGHVPAAATSFSWDYGETYGAVVLRIIAGTEPPITEWLPSGKTSTPYAIGEPYRAPTTMSIVTTYVPLGFTHIVPLGADHIAFVLGIFLLSARMAALLWQVTAFTIAHSITLGLALFGLVQLDPGVVEPLIALSIVYVGVENLLTRELKPWRVALVFAFGLLHGLGFAGVLGEIGLPPGEMVSALIAFNIGVEGGQLAVIILAMAAGGYWFRSAPWYRTRVVVPGSLAISALGGYWLVERTLL